MIKLELPYKVKIVPKINETRMINFSILALTENNSKNIDNFLTSLTEFKEKGGEIIILDMSSTDDTVEKATNFGCRVENISNFYRTIDSEMATFINEKFNSDEKDIVKDGDTYFDYIGAKNYASTLTENDMILMVDVNSVFNILNIEYIEDMIDQKYDYFIISNDAKYNIRKHNSIEIYNKTKFNWIKTTKDTLQSISEYGYIQIHENIISITFKDLDDKETTNLCELSIECFLNEGDENLIQEFAKKLLEKDYQNSAYNLFNNHINMTKSNEKKCESLCLLGDFFYNTNRVEDAIQYYHKAYDVSDKLRYPLYKLGLTYYLKNNWKRCILYLEGCLNIDRIPDSIDTDFMHMDGPYSMLYVAYWWIGNKSKGKYYFDKAIKLNPYNQLYIDESVYHYEYKTNNIRDNLNLSFQNLQFLYNKSKTSNKILEICPSSSRSTHALINGCDNIITIIFDNVDQVFIDNYLKELDYPGNLRIINKSVIDSIIELEENGENFDFIIMHNYGPIIDYNQVWFSSIWEKIATKLVCGSNYSQHKETLDYLFEITGTNDDIWYKEYSSFERTITYKRKKNNL